MIDKKTLISLRESVSSILNPNKIGFFSVTDIAHLQELIDNELMKYNGYHDTMEFYPGDIGVVNLPKNFMQYSIAKQPEICDLCLDFDPLGSHEVEMYWPGHKAEGINAQYCPQCGRKL